MFEPELRIEERILTEGELAESKNLLIEMGEIFGKL
jgi:hypothetical protein